MTILIISEYSSGGGAEKIACFQSDLLEEQGHHVERMYFHSNPYGDRSKDKTDKGILIETAHFFKPFLNPVFIYRIRAVVRNLSPDLIITHNVFSSPLSVYKALEGYPIVHVAHDSFMLCPNYVYVPIDGCCKVCSGMQWDKCVRHCSNSIVGKIKLFLMYRMLDKLQKVVREKVKLVVTPSNYLGNELSNLGTLTKTINNPIDSHLYKALQEKKNLRRFVYCGGFASNKGAGFLTEVLLNYETGITEPVDYYGGIAEKSLLELTEKSAGIRYRGYMDSSKIMEALPQYDFLFLPSKLENYPTMALEAMLNGVIVIGSNVGGIPEIIGDGRGILFESGNADALYKAIRQALQMKDDEYNRIRKQAFDYVKNNNSVEDYSQHMNSVFSEVLTL